jgi:F0F1-type ATP synthase membrane subunit b/b'
VQRENEVQVKINDANENASAARVEAATQLEQQKRELEDVQAEAGSVDDLRRKRGCLVLRQQGRDVSKIPACR